MVVLSVEPKAQARSFLRGLCLRSEDAQGGQQFEKSRRQRLVGGRSHLDTDLSPGASADGDTTHGAQDTSTVLCSPHCELKRHPWDAHPGLFHDPAQCPSTERAGRLR